MRETIWRPLAYRHPAMSRRFCNRAAGVAVAAFCLFSLAWFAAGGVDPRKQHLSVARDCHISIDARGWDARLEIFNDSSYGPYAGSIVGIAGDPNCPTVSGVGDAAGVYYRMIRWPDGRSLWTLSLSLIYPTLVTLVIPFIWFVRRTRRSVRGFPVDAN